MSAIACLLSVSLPWATNALTDDGSLDPTHACDRAAARAEAGWGLPRGLLSAIGIVESGRGDLGGTRPIAWPWTINFDGRGLYLPSKAAAITTVNTIRGPGVRIIDVGCFQVDLYFHPDAFVSLDAAFDPDTNANAAARILVQARFSGGSWERAIALYHSASIILGERYAQHVQAVRLWAKTRIGVGADSGMVEYAVLLSPAARLVRIVTAADSPPPLALNLPRVVGPQDAAGLFQWIREPQNLPIVLVPARGPRPTTPSTPSRS